MSNRPDLQQQIDKLERRVELLQSAVLSLVAAQLPAMRAIDLLTDAAQKVSDAGEDD